MAHLQLIKVAAAAAAAFVVVIALITPQAAEAAMSCSDVASNMSPCLGYLQNGGTPPSYTSRCCNGVRAVNNAQNSQQDRQAACRCIKSLAPAINAKPEFINGLPQKCGVTVPYVYSSSLDCSTVR